MNSPSSESFDSSLEPASPTKNNPNFTFGQNSIPKQINNSFFKFGNESSHSSQKEQQQQNMEAKFQQLVFDKIQTISQKEIQFDEILKEYHYITQQEMMAVDSKAKQHQNSAIILKNKQQKLSKILSTQVPTFSVQQILQKMFYQLVQPVESQSEVVKIYEEKQAQVLKEIDGIKNEIDRFFGYFDQSLTSTKKSIEGQLEVLEEQLDAYRKRIGEEEEKIMEQLEDITKQIEDMMDDEKKKGEETYEKMFEHIEKICWTINT